MPPQKTNPDHHWEFGVEFVMGVDWDGGRTSRSMLCVCVYHDSFSFWEWFPGLFYFQT